MLCSPHSSRMGYYCPTHVTAHQSQQHQGKFFPFHLQAYVTHELMEGNAKAGVWLRGELFGGPCATCFATCFAREQGKAVSPHPLQCLAGLVPVITPPAAQTPSDGALAQNPPPGLSRERAIRENMLPFNFPCLTQAWKFSIHSCLYQRSGFSVGFFPSLSLAWKKAAEPQVMQFD